MTTDRDLDDFKRGEADLMIRQHPDSHGVVYALLRETRQREIVLQKREAEMVKQARLQALRDARSAVLDAVPPHREPTLSDELGDAIEALITEASKR